jgi:hypothetical protein
MPVPVERSRCFLQHPYTRVKALPLVRNRFIGRNCRVAGNRWHAMLDCDASRGDTLALAGGFGVCGFPCCGRYSCGFDRIDVGLLALVPNSLAVLIRMRDTGTNLTYEFLGPDAGSVRGHLSLDRPQFEWRDWRRVTFTSSRTALI